MKVLDKVRVRTGAAAGTRARHAMWAVRKNPADLSGEQRTSLASIQATNTTLYRAYLLKEQLRALIRHGTLDTTVRPGGHTAEGPGRVESVVAAAELPLTEIVSDRLLPRGGISVLSATAPVRLRL